MYYKGSNNIFHIYRTVASCLPTEQHPPPKKKKNTNNNNFGSDWARKSHEQAEHNIIEPCTVSQWMNEWVSEWANEWMNEQESEQMNEWRSHY